MKLYKTKENNIINLEQVTLIYRSPETGVYNVSFTNGMTYEMPEIGDEDISNIMEYNNHFII